MKIIDALHIPIRFKPRGTMRKLYYSPMPLWALLEGLKENQKLKVLTERGRALAITNPTEFKSWKPSNLMSAYPSVYFKEGEVPANKDHVIGLTGLAVFDFDDVDVEFTLRALKEIPECIAGIESVSGRGVWAICAVDASTPSEYERCYAAGIETMTLAGITGIDCGVFDINRARFLAHSSKLWWRCGADRVPAFPPKGDINVLPKRQKRERTELPPNYVMTPSVLSAEIRAELETAKDVPDGEHNNAKASQAGIIKSLCIKAGVSPALYFNDFCAAWDAVGSTPKKTRDIANRLLLGGN